MSIADFANELPPGARLSNLADFLVEENQVSPIDAFTVRIKEILDYGTVETLDTNRHVGRLLLLAVVAAAEAYFRAVLSASMELCPLSQAGASEKAINLGGLLWHGHQRFSHSAFDNSSFSSAQELRKATRDYVAFSLEESIFRVPLDEYDKVCQFRHGIVHGDGFLPGKNAVKLDIPRFARPVRITLGYSQLQDISAVVNTLIVLYNRQLFEEFCKRWAVQWRQRTDWSPTHEETIFSQIWSIFHSREEWKRRRGRSAVTKARCMSLVRTTYHI